jgi:acetaldehyde dehydrogenase/alcohol dehydrogenase
MNPAQGNAADSILEKAVLASAVFSGLDQAHTDRIVRAVYQAGFNARVKLAKMAHEETGMGRWEDKVIKNVVATQLVYEDIKDLKTVGIVSENKETGISEIAQPMGPILAIIPVTNPTSTALFKILSALKTRNPIIVCPSKKAIRCCAETARICYEAALREDAPEDCIQWLTEVSREQTQALMGHDKLALILATGGSGLVRSAYSSGTPAMGVGAGNVPVFIEKSADVQFAVEQILLSKTFDNGTICASEQAVVVEQTIAEAVRAEFIKRGAYFLSKQEIPLLESVAWDPKSKNMNPDVVGQPAGSIALKAGFQVPPQTRVLIAPLEAVGHTVPLSSEILAPILAYYVADGFDEAVKRCIDLNYHGGIGHTASMYSNDDERIRQFSILMNAGRIVVNTPSSQGAVGGILNTLRPSLTLGCGTSGKNITTENVTARNLLNIQRITRRRPNLRWIQIDASRYLDESLDAETAEREYNSNC